MKKTLLMILNVFIAQLMIGQTETAISQNFDPFNRMIKTIYSLDALSFRSQNNTKQVFEIDTITSYANVIVKKKGTIISFLQIIPEEENQELLFCIDSAWVIDHKNKKMICIGTNTDDLTYNGMSKFFSFTLFNIDTVISRMEPFWRIIEQTKVQTVIALDFANSSKDLSDMRAEFTIYNSSFLPYKTLQESVYLKADKIFQEQIFTGYSFPDPEDIKVPEYFSSYEKDLSIFLQADSVVEIQTEEPPVEVFLQDIELYDFYRNPVSLPDKGLIFIDLWYVGCSPCMKSAPVIEKLYIEYRDRVHFFSVNETDMDTAKIARFKDKMNLTFPVLLGGKEKLAMRINGTSGYPVFILMDGQSRKLLWKIEGYNEHLEELIRKTIEQNL